MKRKRRGYGNAGSGLISGTPYSRIPRSVIDVDSDGIILGTNIRERAKSHLNQTGGYDN